LTPALITQLLFKSWKAGTIMNTALPAIQGCAVAYGRSTSASAAVEQCARQLQDCRPLLLLVFAGGKHDYEGVLGTFQMEFPSIPIVGGSAAGAISRDGFGYSGLEIGALAITDPRLLPKVIVSRDLLVPLHSGFDRLAPNRARSGKLG